MRATTTAAAEPRQGRAASTRWALPRRWAWPAAFTAGAVALFFAVLRLAGTQPVKADAASNALQAWQMLHGNPLLHGWWLTDVSFYTTELPQFMLVELVAGLRRGGAHLRRAHLHAARGARGVRGPWQVPGRRGNGPRAAGRRHHARASARRDRLGAAADP